MARTKPNKCYEMGCPLAIKCACGHWLDEHPEDGHCTRVENEELCECNGFQSKGKGFVLGVGDPSTAKLSIILEAPGAEEISFPIDGPGAPGIIPVDELQRRERDYPELAGTRFVKVGAPVVGESGSLLNQWILPKVGVRREDVYVDNTLRCLPPKNKQGQPYPIEEEKAKAEGCCREWDRVQKFDVKVVELSLHPAGILREVTPLPLLIKDFEKAVGFTRQGYNTLLLLGGKAAEVFLGYGENVTRWRGHYEVLTSGVKEWYDGVLGRTLAKVGKGKKVKKIQLGKAASIDLAASITSDILETPSLPSPTFFPTKKRAKRRVRCKECMSLGEHKMSCSTRGGKDV